MTLSDLASLGTFVSSFAVLVSVIVLFVQLRQMNEQMRRAEKNQQAANAVEMGAAATEFALRLVDPVQNEILGRLYRSDPEFTQDELLQAMNIVNSFVYLLGDTVVLRELSLIDETTIETRLNPVRLLFGQASVRALWPLIRQNFSGKVREMVEHLIRTEPVRAPVDFLSIYRSSLASIKRTRQTPGDSS